MQWLQLFSLSRNIVRHHSNIMSVDEWRYMAAEIYVNIGSGNGLLPDGTQLLPEPMLINNHDMLWHSPYFTGNT